MVRARPWVERPGLEPWTGILCAVLGEDTLLAQLGTGANLMLGAMDIPSIGGEGGLKYSW